MKSILRRILGCITAAMLMCALPVLAFAAEGDEDGNGTPNPPDPTYSITVVNENSGASISGATCSVYKVMDVTIGTPPEGQENVGLSYRYSLTDDFSSFEYNDDAQTLSGEALINALNKENTSINLTSLTEQLGNWADGKDSSGNPVGNKITPTKSSEIKNAETATIEGLSPGYYLVTVKNSNDENLCLPALRTLIDKNETVKAKFESTQVTKVISKIDGNDANNTTSSTVEVGATIEFKVETAVPSMSDGFAEAQEAFNIIDSWQGGLEPDLESVKITIGGETVYENKAPTIENLCSVEEADSSFTISFTPSVFYDNFQSHAGDAIVITYNATVTDAMLEDGNQDAINNVKIEYYIPDGTGETPGSPVDVYSLAIDVWKYTPNPDEQDTVGNSNEHGNTLEGAKFVLYKEAADKEKTYYKYDETSQKVTWIPEENKEQAILTTVEGQALRFAGLAAGQYYLEEVEPPTGYNGIKEPILIDLTQLDLENNVFTKEQLVANSKGIVLPGTGGMGTIIFYCVGGALVLGALVVLIARRRMASRDK